MEGALSDFDYGIRKNNLGEVRHPLKYRNTDLGHRSTFDLNWNYQAAALTAWTLNALDIDAITEGEGGLSYGELSATLSVIPEPSSALLAGLGCAVFFRRRKIRLAN